MQYSKYHQDLPYSYVFGAFGTIELLKNQPQECLTVLVDPSFIKNESYQLLNQLCKKNKIDLIVNGKMVGKIRDKGNIFVIGVFKKYHSQLSNKKHIVLYNIDDVGMVGTIIRSMKGFYFDNLVLIHCNIDLFNEHLIRSTMGAFFSTNIEEFTSFKEYQQKYQIDKMYLISNEGHELQSVQKSDEMAIIFANQKQDLIHVKKIKMNQDISMDHLVNIVLFYLNN